MDYLVVREDYSYCQPEFPLLSLMWRWDFRVNVIWSQFSIKTHGLKSSLVLILRHYVKFCFEVALWLWPLTPKSVSWPGSVKVNLPANFGDSSSVCFWILILITRHTDRQPCPQLYFVILKCASWIVEIYEKLFIFWKFTVLQISLYKFIVCIVFYAMSYFCGKCCLSIYSFPAFIFSNVPGNYVTFLL